MFRFLLLFLAISAPPFLPASDIGQKVDALFTEAFPADEPGSAVILKKGDAVLLRKAYGLANVEHGVPNTTDTLFRVGSVTKSFTAAGIMLLVEDGKLKLDDNINVHLPDFPTQGNEVTVRHLLNHTSGIKSYTSIPSVFQRAPDNITTNDVLELFKDEPFNFKPGEEWRYNNSGYYLLGFIIERVSGQTYAEFLEKRIFQPLGMSHTQMDETGPIIPNRANGYGWRGPKFINTQMNPLWPWSAGGVISTVDDMAKWADAIHDRTLLSKDSWKQVVADNQIKDGSKTGYGFGFFLQPVRDTKTISHGGDTLGFSADFFTVPDQKLTLIVLNNHQGRANHPHQIALEGLALAIGKPFPTFTEKPVAEAALKQYEGVYQLGEKDLVYIRVVDGQLQSQRNEGKSYELKYAGDHTFYFTFDKMSWVTFEHKNQKVTGFSRVLYGGAKEQAPKVDKPLPDLKQESE